MTTPTAELAWFKSSYSSTGNDNCVEVAASPTAVHIRDSKDTDRPEVTLSLTAWADFVARV
ncbi:DUF397 domain-containing protein [Streptomyces coeruleoprunus]|uniref:DUF397 domain-containing protein n=1 Tax=Streptomyces coeruleoprunus TaxID=285563 RepID=A0ABV9XGB5_9ACTN